MRVVGKRRRPVRVRWPRRREGGDAGGWLVAGGVQRGMGSGS